MGGWLRDNALNIVGFLGVGGIVSALAMVGGFIASNPAAALLLSVGMLLTGFWAGAAYRDSAAKRERRDYGDLPPVESFPRDCMQLLYEMEDGAVHRIERGQLRRKYAADLLEGDGYISLYGYGDGASDYRLTNDARRVLAARRREWRCAKKDAGIPDDSVFADDLEYRAPSIKEQVRASSQVVI